MRQTKFILPIIVISQFFCTSTWFAGNAIINDLVIDFRLEESSLGHLTSAVQFGFIIGTLTFAILTIVDRFSPSKVFFISALIGSTFNLVVIWEGNNLFTLILLRFLTGFFLAGIYPVGMKIAVDYFEKGLGKSLGYLVGALVVGTAFPHLLRDLTKSFPWEYVQITTSLLSLTGGLLIILLVPDGPFRKPSKKVSLVTFLKVFGNKNFRSTAFGYFGHMWELYAFWTFVPYMLKEYNINHPQTTFNTSLASFIIIGVGGFACVFSGYIGNKYGPKRIAFLSLLLSCLCCLISPFILSTESEVLFFSFLIFWGMVVIADSPLFSTLLAQNVSTEVKGTALTIVNCIGYSITIISIQLITSIKGISDPKYLYLVLAIGPILGLIALTRQNKKNLLYRNDLVIN